MDKIKDMLAGAGGNIVLAIVISEGIYVLTSPFFPFLYGESRRFGIESGRTMSRYR